MGGLGDTARGCADAFLGWKADRLSLSTTYVTDVSDEYNGDVWYFNGYYEIPIDEQFRLSLGAYTTWASDDYMETYFGVNSGDAKPPEEILWM